jgi:hypothetical protein
MLDNYTSCFAVRDSCFVFFKITYCGSKFHLVLLIVVAVFFVGKVHERRKNEGENQIVKPCMSHLPKTTNTFISNFLIDAWPWFGLN